MDPPGEKLLAYGPMIIIVFLHAKQDAVATVVYCVYREGLLVKTPKLSEIEFPEAAAGFDETGIMNNPGEVYLHRFIIKKMSATISMLTFYNEKKKVLHKLNRLITSAKKDKQPLHN
jgi:hypothetical protein